MKKIDELVITFGTLRMSVAFLQHLYLAFGFEHPFAHKRDQVNIHPQDNDYQFTTQVNKLLAIIQMIYGGDAIDRKESHVWRWYLAADLELAPHRFEELKAHGVSDRSLFSVADEVDLIINAIIINSAQPKEFLDAKNAFERYFLAFDGRLTLEILQGTRPAIYLVQ